MKVWMNKRTGGYSGGLLLVAANSKQEAHELCLNSSGLESIYWEFGYDYFENDRYKIPACHCYDWGGWAEVPNLWYDGVKPCVIAEEGYTE